MKLTPNFLSYLRILLSLIIPIFLIANPAWLSRLLGFLLFLLAIWTDMWDGILARRRGLITATGKILDPIADKFLVLAMMFSFVWLRLYPIGFVLPILAREMAVTTARLFCLRRGRVIAAERAGKIKTATQIGSLFLSFLVLVERDYWRQVVFEKTYPRLFESPLVFSNYLILVVSNVLTLYSGGQFFVNNWKILFGKPA